MKIIIKILSLILVFLFFSILIPIKPDNFFVSTFFTVLSIMFTLGLSIISTFDIKGIKNKNYVRQIRNILNKIRNSYILYFFISSALYILDKQLIEHQQNIFLLVVAKKSFELNLSLLLCVTMLYFIVFYTYNYIKLQKLNEEIFDRINEENS